MLLGASFVVQVLLVVAMFVIFGLAVLLVAFILFREDDASVGQVLYDLFPFFGGR